MGGRGGGVGELLAICVREPQLTGVFFFFFFFFCCFCFRQNGICNDYYRLLSLNKQERIQDL